MSQLHSFSTRDLPSQVRVRSWEARLRTALGDVRVTAPSCAADFDAWSETLSDNGVLVGRVGACGQQIEQRVQRRITSRDHKIHVMFQLSGRFEIEQFGRRAMLEPGDWAFVVVTEAFRTAHDMPAEMLVLDAPRRAVFPDIAADRLSAHRFSCEHGSACLAKSYLNTLVTERTALHPLTTAELAATAARLVRLSVIENLGARSEIKVHQMLQVRIRDFIDRHLQDSDLSVESVAEALHCSKRYVHKVFSAGGESLSQYILRMRLERCRQDLQRRELNYLSLTQVAFSWGFNSPGHFSRVFRRQFGVRPSDCRKQLAKTQFPNGTDTVPRKLSLLPVPRR